MIFTEGEQKINFHKTIHNQIVKSLRKCNRKTLSSKKNHTVFRYTGKSKLKEKIQRALEEAMRFIKQYKTSVPSPYGFKF